MEGENEEYEARNAIIEEKGSCFQLSSKADGDLEANLDSSEGSTSSFSKATSTRLRPSDVTMLTPGGGKKC